MLIKNQNRNSIKSVCPYYNQLFTFILLSIGIKLSVTKLLLYSQNYTVISQGS